MSIKSMAVLLAIALLSIVKLNGQSMSHMISGTTWLDIEDIGVRSIDDIDLPDVRIDLFNEQGLMIQFTETDINGNYAFTNLPTGNYYLKFSSPQGLMFTLKDVGDDNFDSDLSSNGISSQFSLNTLSPTVNIDAGFRSAILIQTKAFINICQGEIVDINPTITGNNGNLSYNWSHDGSTESNTSLTTDSNLLITLTVLDDWQIPVNKNIFIKVSEGVGSKDCGDVDLFDSSEIDINIFVSESDPGPITTTDINETFIGGARSISIELLEGSNISSINSSTGGVFINNCSGCRTSTTLTYFNPNNDFLDISIYDYFELTEMNIDQGNVAVTITLTDDNNSSQLSSIIESEGPNTNILPVFFFEDFDNHELMDLSMLKTISLNFTSINESIDILMSSILSCADEACSTTLIDSHELCLTDSVTLSPETDCNDGLIYFWEDLGFGMNKTVSPTTNTTYLLTIFDQNGCSLDLTSTVNVNLPPTVEIESPEYACFGESIRVNANIPTGSPPYHYQWNGISSDSSFIEFLASNDTTITVIVTDSLGCIATAQTTITVHENPSISLNVTNSLCSQPSGSIKAQISGGTPPYTLEWSNGIMNQDSITNLDFGVYTLEVTDSLGCSTSASAFVNYLPCAALGNYVWHDINYNGIQDSTDLPLQDVIVLLRNDQDKEISRDTSDENGIYLFEELEGGEYYVEYIPPTDFYPTLPYASSDEMIDSNADTLTQRSNKITLSEYEKNLTIDAGWYKKVCLGDQVWNDINHNHYYDSLDIAIENVVVKLLDCNENLLDSILTDSLGHYSFCDLDPGEYALQFCNPEGFIPVDMNVGGDAIDSDINAESSTTDCKTLLSGDTLTVCDAGFYSISSIGDYVWHDLNANGLQDHEEPVLEGVSLNLFTCDGQLLSSTNTDSTGFYLFDSLPAGSYYLDIITDANAILSPQGIGLDSLLDSDFASVEKRTSCINLGSGVDLRDIDAGLYYEASLGDYVWIDYDLDGFQNTEEQAVDNLKIYLFSCDEELIDSTYSDEQGHYLFEGLRPDKYYIQIELPENHEVTIIDITDSELNNDIDNTTLSSSCVTLSSSQYHRDLDIGLYNFGKIGDLVWFDENGNGIQDSTEEGFPDIKINLLDCNDNIISTTVSNDNGEYCFSDIPYGDYVVHFDVPDPYFIVNAHEGNDPSIDSDAHPTSNATDCIILSSPVDSTLDAGITTCSTIGGNAWFDISQLNNIKDPVENGVNGIKVNAFKNVNGNWLLESETYTGLKPGDVSEDGYWEMCVSPGAYYIQFSNIPVIEAVEPNQGNNEYLDSDVVHAFGINTTDIINVLPGIDDISIGIGYRWKNTFGKIPQNINSEINRVIFNELESTLTIEHSSTEQSVYNYQRDILSLENKASEKPKLYPNPTTGLINIHIPDPMVEPLDYIIYENTGRQIRPSTITSTYENQILSIQVNDLKPGIYHIKIINKDKIEWLPFVKI